MFEAGSLAVDILQEFVDAARGFRTWTRYGDVADELPNIAYVKPDKETTARRQKFARQLRKKWNRQAKKQSFVKFGSNHRVRQKSTKSWPRHGRRKVK